MKINIDLLKLVSTLNEKDFKCIEVMTSPQSNLFLWCKYMSTTKGYPVIIKIDEDGKCEVLKNFSLLQKEGTGKIKHKNLSYEGVFETIEKL